jgi:RNA polymerase sigma-70 factor (ECF subfamily)
MTVDINILYSQALKGDKTAEHELFRHLSDRIRYSVHRRVGNKQDAEELAQEALLTVLKEYQNVEISTSFAAWVFKIVDNRILAYWGTKQRTRDRHMPLDASTDLPAHTHPDPDLKRQLLKCLKQLGEIKVRHARAIVLSTQGYSSDEICSRMNLTRNAFYLLLSRARAMLAGCLEKGSVTS